MTEIKVEVAGITVDPSSNAPIVILRTLDGEKMLPIWIGALEATSIATELEKIKSPRPMTHDLFISTLHEMGVAVEKIVICDLADNTYFARLHLRDRQGKKYDIDARPSDSIALAVRVNAEIYVADSVLAQAGSLDKESLEKQQKQEEDRWKEILENLSEDDLGKYRM